MASRGVHLHETQQSKNYIPNEADHEESGTRKQSLIPYEADHGEPEDKSSKTRGSAIANGENHGEARLAVTVPSSAYQANSFRLSQSLLLNKSDDGSAIMLKCVMNKFIMIDKAVKLPHFMHLS